MAKKDMTPEAGSTPADQAVDTVTDTPDSLSPEKEKGLGNTGSITGNSHTAEAPSEHGQPQPSKLAVWWQRIVGSIGILALLGVGIFYVFTMINTPPIAVNPTSEPVTFEIDGSGVTIPAGGYLELKMSRGKHVVTADGKELGTFEYGWFDEDSVLNPTMSAFVIADILYAASSGYESKLQNRTLTIEGETIEWPYTLIEPTLYIKKSWDYDQFNNKSPSTVRIKGNYAIKKELFSIPGFIRAYENGDV